MKLLQYRSSLRILLQMQLLIVPSLYNSEWDSLDIYLLIYPITENGSLFSKTSINYPEHHLNNYIND